MSEPEFPQWISDNLASGEGGLRSAYTIIRELRQAHHVADEKIVELVAGSALMQGQDDAKAIVLKALRQLAANESQVIVIKKKSDWPTTNRMFIKTTWPHLLRYKKEFFDYESGAYRSVSDATISASAWQWLAAAKIEAKDEETNKYTTKPFCPLSKDVTELVTASTHDRHLLDTAQWPMWMSGFPGTQPTAIDCVSFPNGILDTGTGKFFKPTSAFLTFNAVEFDYNPDADAPKLWLDTLAQYWPNDPQCLLCLQEWFGYLITTNAKFHKALMLLGPRRSGKGTILEVLEKVIGSSNVAATSLQEFGERFGLQSLLQKSVAIIPEAVIDPKNDNVTVIKSNLLRLSSNDLMSVQRKNTTTWTGRLCVRVVMVANELPHFKDNGGALAGRYIILPMLQSFYGHEDKTLAKRIIATELPGILNWALQGLERLLRQDHFTEPASGELLREDMADLASPLKPFIEDCCEFAEGDRVEKQALYRVYLRDCAERGMKFPSNAAVFGRDLISAGGAKIRSIKERHGTKWRRFYGGIRLTVPAPAEPMEDIPF